jgi:hypothetical protein
MQYHKRITLATCGLVVAVLEEAVKNGEQSVLRVAGKLTGSEAKDGDLGPYICFSGEIAAINLVTGEEHRAPSCILPPVAEMALVGLVENLEEGSSVQFAVEVIAQPNNSAKGGCKYKYAVRNLIEPKEDDSLTRLLKGLPQLAAPAKNTGKTTDKKRR